MQNPTTKCDGRSQRISESFYDKVVTPCTDVVMGNRLLRTADDVLDLGLEILAVYRDVRQAAEAPEQPPIGPIIRIANEPGQPSARDIYCELTAALDQRLDSADKDAVFGMLTELVDALMNDQGVNNA